MFSLNTLLFVTFPSHILWVLTLHNLPETFKPFARTHNVVIIVIIVVIAMLTLCYSIMSHATLIACPHLPTQTTFNSNLARERNWM